MKPSIPRGTRDFGPAEMQKRQYILSTIRRNFELFGFEQIETPSMENSSTLMGKYGEEGDKLIFKILNSGNYFSDFKNDEEIINAKNNGEKHFTKFISEKALRYDLTVPFARYVVMNQHQLTFPFKRYQIQPVWRADRPQKGRYREFYQCDADIIGSDSLINELDLVSLIDKSFHELQVPVVLKVNNRKILAGIAEIIGAPERMIDIAIAIDKLDKIGTIGVLKELTEKNFAREQIDLLIDILALETSIPKTSSIEIDSNNYTLNNNSNRIDILKEKTVYMNSSIFRKGIEEMEFLLNNLSVKNLNIELDFSLARGLNYYTGTIFEVKANAGTFTPSILGGGRYDDLTGIFGLPNMSGVGISFGIDRIYDVMEELNIFPESIGKTSNTIVLFTHFDEESQRYCLKLAAELRKNELACEIYPDITKKIGKQFDYANKKNIPFVCTVGSNEIEKGAFSIKHMSTGNKQELNISDMIHFIKKELHELHN